MARRFQDRLQRRLQDPEFREAWEECRQEHEIAEAIERLRKQKGWTQSELARRLNTRQSVISRIERGDHNLTVASMNKIFKVLDADVKIVVEKNGKPVVTA